ncbi:MAG: outer membrane beta-barrel protein [Roseiarcus sp.]
MRRSLLLSFVALSAIASSAFAADLPTQKGPPPAPTTVMAPYSWAGFYVGVNGGYADPTAKLSVAPGGYWGGDVDWTANSNGPGVAALATRDIGLHGFIGGVTAGYNYQINNVVLGVEADADHLRLKGSYATTSYPGYYNTGEYWANGSASIDSLFTLRLRAGLAFDRLLVFATGGLAVTNEKFSQLIGFYNNGASTLPDTNGAYGYNAGSASTTAVTGVVGGGLEYAFDNHWSLKGEYLYVPLKSQSFTSNYSEYGTGNPYTVYHHESLSALNVFRAGLNYRF